MVHNGHLVVFLHPFGTLQDSRWGSCIVNRLKRQSVDQKLIRILYK